MILRRYWKYLREGAVRLLLVLSGLVISLVIAEVSLRILAPIPYSQEVEYIPDGHLGHRLAPNKTYLLKSGGEASINNLGFRRDNDIQYLKPANTFRIVVLGGSAAFSYEVDDEKTWVSLLETNLRNAYGHQIEVINAGVPGYSILQSKINYLYRIRRMSPDVVIVYHTWNDMKYFKALEAGLPLTKGVITDNWIKSLLRNLQTAWRVRNFYHQYILPRQRENTYADSLSADIQTIADGGAAHHWERTNFEDLALLLESDDVLPVFLIQAALFSEDNIDDPDIRAVVYAEYQGLTFNQILEQWQAVSNIISDVAYEKGAILVDTYSLVPHDLDHFFDEAHLTELGNKVVADTVSQALKTNESFNDFIKMRTSQ